VSLCVEKKKKCFSGSEGEDEGDWLTYLGKQQVEGQRKEKAVRRRGINFELRGRV